MKKHCVFVVVRTEVLNVIYMRFGLRELMSANT
jgi:hypothetical protein